MILDDRDGASVMYGGDWDRQAVKKEAKYGNVNLEWVCYTEG